MKLFDDFDAVKFTEENLLFIAKNGYLYYIYNPKYECWNKHRNAGNDSITVANYVDVPKEELIAAMQGKFPEKETDFMRLCHPSQLWIRDMLDLLKDDYESYMADYSIYHSVHELLLESDICYRSFLKIQDLFNNAIASKLNNEQVLIQVKELCLAILGRDIFKKEIGIVDGHDCSSYFWIRPVRIFDSKYIYDIDDVAEMQGVEISIEEDDVNSYLTPFLFKYFDGELEANKKRVDEYWTDEDGNEKASYVRDFEWYLTHNFYTLESVKEMLDDVRDTIDAFDSERETDLTTKLKEKNNDHLDIELVVDFYHRFIYRMEYMIKVAAEKGYDLISFMGP